jgi:hypothetical protein
MRDFKVRPANRGVCPAGHHWAHWSIAFAHYLLMSGTFLG